MKQNSANGLWKYHFLWLESTLKFINCSFPLEIREQNTIWECEYSHATCLLYEAWSLRDSPKGRSAMRTLTGSWAGVRSSKRWEAVKISSSHPQSLWSSRFPDAIVQTVAGPWFSWGWYVQGHSRRWSIRLPQVQPELSSVPYDESEVTLLLYLAY